MIRNKIFFIIIFLLGFNSILYPQSIFRSGIFLHRSVGASIWGSSQGNTNVPNEMHLYNQAHSYTGDNAVGMDEVLFPWNNSGNEWWRWHKILDNEDLYGDDIYPYLENNKIIVIKSCYPSSDMSEGWGSPADTINYDWKSVEVYKWHWRSIIRVMEQHPENFFVIWTNAPKLEVNSQPSWALHSHLFCTWAKDTLAAGLDPIYGVFPPNVYVFDYFHKVVDENFFLKPIYAVSSSDNHPNATATELIAPQFVNEIFDAAIVYEQSIVPVELTLFSGKYEDGVVNLKWITATETNNFGFDVQRRNDNSSYESIGFVNGNGTSTNRLTYNFVDDNLSASKYYYRLKQIDLDGSFEYSNEVEINIDALSDFQLYQNYPNPFNPSTEINFTLAKSGNITLKVYSSLGSEVATLAEGFMNSGKHSVKFNAKDFSTGIYFYRITADNFTSTRKMLLIK